MSLLISSFTALFKLKHFPLLLAADYNNLEIYMNYCGENLKENNIPQHKSLYFFIKRKTMKIRRKSSNFHLRHVACL